jgi:WD40 repeat protein
VRYLTGHTDSITALAYSPSGRVLASAGWDGKVCWWDCRTGERLGILRSVHERALALAWGNEQTLGVGYRHSLQPHPPSNLVVYTSETANYRFARYADWATSSGDCRALAFHPTSELLFTLGRRGEWLGWNFAGHPCTERRISARFAFYALGCAADWLIALNYTGATLHRWRLGTNIWRVDATEETTANGHALALTPSGFAIAYSASARIYLAPPIGSTGVATPLGQHEDDVLGLAFAHDGRTLVSGGRDGLVKVWDVANGYERRAFDWEVGEAAAVAVAPDGMTAAVGGYDGRVLMWDLADE